MGSTQISWVFYLTSPPINLCALQDGWIQFSKNMINGPSKYDLGNKIVLFRTPTQFMEIWTQPSCKAQKLMGGQVEDPADLSWIHMLSGDLQVQFCIKNNNVQCIQLRLSWCPT